MPVGGLFDKEKNAKGNVIITEIVGFLSPGFEFLLELICCAPIKLDTK
jgi:hypothetical protein